MPPDHAPAAGAVAGLQAAAPDFAAAQEIVPTVTSGAPWLYLAPARAGQLGRAEIEKCAPRLSLREWPGPVVSLCLGQSTPERTLAAEANPEPKRRQEQPCEAELYVGEYFLLRGAKAEIRRLGN